MKKLNFNFNLKHANGQDFKEQGKAINLGTWLAGRLEETNEGSSKKFIGWAQLLAKGEPILVDDDDKDKLKQFIEKQKFANIIEFQLLEVIDNAKEMDANSNGKEKVKADE